MNAVQFVDPDVSRRKFETEVEQFRALAGDYRRRGWFLLEAEFPVVFVMLVVPQLQPAPVLTGVEFDYTNYDAVPPSVVFVNPFTRQPYLARELPTALPRAISQQEIQIAPGLQAKLMPQQNLLQSYGPDEIPFLCLAGVREYHAHPAHSGDAWGLYRAGGAGRLIRLLEVIDTYGVQPISEYNVALVQQVRGLSQSRIPE